MQRRVGPRSKATSQATKEQLFVRKKKRIQWAEPSQKEVTCRALERSRKNLPQRWPMVGHFYFDFHLFWSLDDFWFVQPTQKKTRNYHLILYYTVRLKLIAICSRKEYSFCNSPILTYVYVFVCCGKIILKSRFILSMKKSDGGTIHGSRFLWMRGCIWHESRSTIQRFPRYHLWILQDCKYWIFEVLHYLNPWKKVGRQIRTPSRHLSLSSFSQSRLQHIAPLII